MSGFANSGDLPLLLGFGLTVSALTAGITFAVRRFWPNARNAVVAIGSGLMIPVLIFSFGFALFLSMSAGDSPDGPGMLLAGIIGFTIVALPISLLTSAAVVSIRPR